MNRDVGWIVGPRLLQTTDGGRAWNQIRSDGYGTFTSESIGFGHRVIQFITAASGVQLDLNTVVKTADGGRTWGDQFSLPERHKPEVPSGSLFFLTPDVGWVVNEMVYHTSDGGRNWTRLSATPRGHDERQRAMRVASTMANFIPALWFVDAQVGLMARLDGEVYRTIDGGSTWSRVWTVDSRITNIFFINNKKGWLTGDRGLIAQTTDGGLTWLKQVEPTAADFTSIFFISEETGWAVGSGTTIVYTRDGGLTWMKGSVSGLIGVPPLASVSFSDELHGWAVGGDGQGISPSPFAPSNVILSTNDGGQNLASSSSLIAAEPKFHLKLDWEVPQAKQISRVFQTLIRICEKVEPGKSIRQMWRRFCGPNQTPIDVAPGKELTWRMIMEARGILDPRTWLRPTLQAWISRSAIYDLLIWIPLT